MSAPLSSSLSSSANRESSVYPSPVQLPQVALQRSLNNLHRHPCNVDNDGGHNNTADRCPVSSCQSSALRSDGPTEVIHEVMYGIWGGAIVIQIVHIPITALSVHHVSVVCQVDRHLLACTCKSVSLLHRRQRRMLVSIWKRSCVEVRSTRCALSARPATRLSWLSIEGGSARATWGHTVRVCELILWRALGWSVTSGQRMVVRLARCATAACTAARLTRLVIEG
jgi:hypothetical protein